ncbi:MAG: transketolase family protein [Candidatus Altiarchaeota archaeon]
MKFDFKNRRHTRDAYGETLRELGSVYPDLVVLDADLSCSTKTYKFAEKYPDRFFNVGCQEQNLMGMSAGFALEGRLVFASCFAMFGAGRGWEQIRNSIAYDALNVKIVLSHAGLTVGPDGSSHQIIEDLSLMRVIPNMRIMVPADFAETRAVIKHIAGIDGPFYVRLSREKSFDLYPDDYEFDFSEPITLVDGDDVTIFANGFMLAESIKASEELKKNGISARVVDAHTLKPTPCCAVKKAAKETGAVVTVEEHSIYGGLGSMIAEELSESYPVPMKRVGVKDVFGVSGNALKLLEAYELAAKDIARAAKDVVARK